MQTKRRNFPIAAFPIDNQDVLIGVVMAGDAAEIAAFLHVAVDQVERWRCGEEPVPFAVFTLLREREKPVLGERWGGWEGAYLDRGRLWHPDYKSGVSLDDLIQLRELRQLKQLCELQADRIERLLVEKDFYRRQCQREATFGLMLNRIFRSK